MDICMDNPPPMVIKEIHRHRWFEGEKDRQMSWEQARQEWFRLHYDGYRGGRRGHFSEMQRQLIREYIDTVPGPLSFKERQNLAIAWIAENAVQFRLNYEKEYGPVPND